MVCDGYGGCDHEGEYVRMNIIMILIVKKNRNVEIINLYYHHHTHRYDHYYNNNLDDINDDNVIHVNPKLDKRISFVRPYVTLVLPPRKSETGWTGELWSNRVLLILENKDDSIFFSFSDFGFFSIFFLNFLDSRNINAKIKEMSSAKKDLFKG